MCYRKQHIEKNAFSLIEMLLTLAIVGILTTLLMPMLTAMPEKAQLVEAERIMSSVRSDLVSCSLEKGNFPETPVDATTASMETVLGEVIVQEKALFNYTYVTDNNVTPNKCAIYAEKNTNQWFRANPARHWFIKLVIYSGGSAEEMRYSARESMLPASTGPTATDW